MTVLLVEQNANMALHIADYGYVLEVGRIVMEDTCARLLEKDDIQEFYLGLKEAERPRHAALEEEEDMAMSELPPHLRPPSPCTARTPCPGSSATWCGSAATGSPCARSTSGSGAPSPGASTAQRARHVGLGLVALGLQPRRRGVDHRRQLPGVALHRPRHDVGGGVTNGIYTTDSPGQVEYIVNDSGTRFFFAENEEQLDKILEVRGALPAAGEDLRLRHGGPPRLPGRRR